MARRHKRAKFLKKNVVVPEVRKVAQPRKMERGVGQGVQELKKEKMMAPSRRLKRSPQEMDTEYQYPWDTPPSKKTTPSKKKKMYGGKKGEKKKSEFDKLYGDWV